MWRSQPQVPHGRSDYLGQWSSDWAPCALRLQVDFLREHRAWGFKGIHFRIQFPYAFLLQNRSAWNHSHMHLHRLPFLTGQKQAESLPVPEWKSSPSSTQGPCKVLVSGLRRTWPRWWACRSSLLRPNKVVSNPLPFPMLENLNKASFGRSLKTTSDDGSPWGLEIKGRKKSKKQVLLPLGKRFYSFHLVHASDVSQCLNL